MVQFLPIAKVRHQPKRVAIALLVSALAMGHAYAQADKCPVPGSGGKPSEAGCLGDTKTGPARSQERQRLRGRYAPPVEMPRQPAPAPDNRLAIPPQSPPRPVPAPPVPITSCDPGGCWDAGGQRYNGSGSTMIRGDGKMCQQVGTMMRCN